MKTVNITILRRMSVEEILGMMPVTVLSDGEPMGVLSKSEDVIVIGDLHIRVRNQFRAREAVVRRGMPKPEKVEIKQKQES